MHQNAETSRLKCILMRFGRGRGRRRKKRLSQRHQGTEVKKGEEEGRVSHGARKGTKGREGGGEVLGIFL
jgi:hypothetical protein